MRKYSQEALDSPAQTVDNLFPRFVYSGMKEMVLQSQFSYEKVYPVSNNSLNRIEKMLSTCVNSIYRVFQLFINRMYCCLYLCHQVDIIDFFTYVAHKNNITIEMRLISRLYSNESLPSSKEAGLALQEKRKFKFPFIPPIPEDMEDLLNEIYLFYGYIPHFQQLLISFPVYLYKFINLQNQLMEKEGTLEQTVCYFLAICSVAEFGCIYLVNRLTKRFLEVGGDVEWLHGKFPEKIKNILPVAHILAYEPYEMKPIHLKNIIGQGSDKWNTKQMVHAMSIINFYHMAATFSLANGINCQTAEEVPYFNLSLLKEQINLKNPETEKKCEYQQQELQKYIKNLNKEESTFGEDIMKMQSKTIDNPKQEELAYTKQINEQMKSCSIYQNIHRTFQNILPPYKKLARRNSKTNPGFQYSEYNFKFFAYPCLSDINEELLNQILTLIEYCKDMTANNFGEYQLNTAALRRAIRYYVENLNGYTHPEYAYRINMTTFLSTQLKFYIKLLILQPFLNRQVVVNKIPHQQNVLGYFDLIHISLLVVNTKFEYAMMMFAKSLQVLLKESI